MDGLWTGSGCVVILSNNESSVAASRSVFAIIIGLGLAGTCSRIA